MVVAIALVIVWMVVTEDVVKLMSLVTVFVEVPVILDIILV